MLFISSLLPDAENGNTAASTSVIVTYLIYPLMHLRDYPDMEWRSRDL
jgi:hypothetical protein